MLSNYCLSHGVRQARQTTATLIAIFVLALGWGVPQSEAKTTTTSISAIPTITSIIVKNGQLLASGSATATIHGKTYTAPFRDVPLNIALSPNQSLATDPTCPVLDLQLGQIHLDLLGLVVETSPICLTITAYSGGGLLGSLLCSIANALNTGLTLDQILAGLTNTDLTTLLSGLTSLLNGALGDLLNSILTGIAAGTTQHTCAILNLDLGPVNLTLLGLQVILDDCSGGPVTVTITGQTGPANLLGNLLCELVSGNLLNLTSTLQDILNQLVGLLTA